MLTITKPTDHPHVVKDDKGEKTHYMGKVDMTMSVPEPKPTAGEEEKKTNV